MNVAKISFTGRETMLTKGIRIRQLLEILIWKFMKKSF